MRRFLQLMVIFSLSAILPFTADAQILKMEDCAIKQYNAEGKVEKIFCDPEPCPVFFRQEPKRVLVILANGVILEWDTKGRYRGIFCKPQDRAVRIMPEGNNYLVETRNGKVFVYSKRGNFKGEYETSGRPMARKKDLIDDTEKLLAKGVKVEPSSRKLKSDSWWRRDEGKRPILGFIKLDHEKKARKDELRLRQARMKESGNKKAKPLVSGEVLVASRKRQEEGRKQMLENRKAAYASSSPRANKNVNKSIPGGPKTKVPTAEHFPKPKPQKGPKPQKKKQLANANPKAGKHTVLKPKVRK